MEIPYTVTPRRDTGLYNATVGITFVKNRAYQRCNPRFEQMFGYGRGELLGESTRAIYCSAEDYERGAAWYEELRTGLSVTAVREYLRKDGSRFWCKLVGKAIDPANRRAGTIWIYADVRVAHPGRESPE